MRKICFACVRNTTTAPQAFVGINWGACKCRWCGLASHCHYRMYLDAHQYKD
jgi:hypothetical protein